MFSLVTGPAVHSWGLTGPFPPWELLLSRMAMVCPVLSAAPARLSWRRCVLWSLIFQPKVWPGAVVARAGGRMAQFPPVPLSPTPSCTPVLPHLHPHPDLGPKPSCAALWHGASVLPSAGWGATAGRPSAVVRIR